MKKVFLAGMSLILVICIVSCKKQKPADETRLQQETADQIPTDAEASEEKPLPAETAKPEEKIDGELMPLPLELPKPMFVGTPANLSGIENLEPDTRQARPPFLAHEGVTNKALNNPVTSSEMQPFTGTLEMIVDGDKEAADGSVVELGPFKQWIQIDLQDEYELYAIVFWHYHKTARVYYDVIVQVSNDEDFVTDVTTLFNNDIDNSLGLGVGEDQHYIDKAEGKLVDAKGTQARYVRLYSQGNNQNDYTHYIEVEVYGK
jgi:hypothetical protein